MFDDNDIFRIYHAKARFRSFFTTMGATLVGCALAAPMLGLQNGRQVMYGYRTLIVPAFVGTWIVTYQIWNRIGGWTPQQLNENAYARNIRMLRNLQIRA